ncbi:MAG: hypothetical protein ABSF52_09500 [Syntrophobacteraceae bacterium]
MRTRDSKLQTRNSKAHRQLTADLAGYVFDPYGWVFYAFPWGEGEQARTPESQQPACLPARHAPPRKV